MLTGITTSSRQAWIASTKMALRLAASTSPRTFFFGAGGIILRKMRTCSWSTRAAPRSMTAVHRSYVTDNHMGRKRCADANGTNKSFVLVLCGCIATRGDGGNQHLPRHPAPPRPPPRPPRRNSPLRLPLPLLLVSIFLHPVRSSRQAASALTLIISSSKVEALAYSLSERSSEKQSTIVEAEVHALYLRSLCPS